MASDDEPILSNPQVKPEFRGLRHRLEELSAPEVGGALFRHHQRALAEGFTLEELLCIRQAKDLCMAVDELLAGEREAESHKGAADTINILFQGQRDGKIKASATRFGNEAVVIHPHQVMEIRAGAPGQVAAVLRRVRLREPVPRPEPQPMWLQEALAALRAGHRVTINADGSMEVHEGSGEAQDPQTGPVAPAAGLAPNDPVVAHGQTGDAGGVGREEHGGDVRSLGDSDEHPRTGA